MASTCLYCALYCNSSVEHLSIITPALMVMLHIPSRGPERSFPQISINKSPCQDSTPLSHSLSYLQINKEKGVRADSTISVTRLTLPMQGIAFWNTHFSHLPCSHFRYVLEHSTFQVTMLHIHPDSSTHQVLCKFFLQIHTCNWCFTCIL